ncbi:MAG: sulfatase [Myxococcota bacterium]
MRLSASGLKVAVPALLALCAGCFEPALPDEIAGARPRELSEGMIWHPERRFAAPLPLTALPPSATIGSETRPALHAADSSSLNYAPAYEVPADGRVALRPPLPDSLQGEAVFLSIRVKPADRWISLPGQRVSSVYERGKLRVHVDFELPESAGRKAGVWVQAFAPRDSQAATHQTAHFRVPEAARLAFAIGVLEPAWLAGAVEFSVSACEGGACETVFRKRVDPARSSERNFLDHAVGLQQWAGREIALRFEARPLGDAGVSLPVWADPVLGVPQPRDAAARNLVLISLDTLRADHIGAYGYARDTTPFLDSLAAEGVLFENYVAASSSTRPSHMTMFTSLYPSVHGATENTGVRALPVSVKTLAELLREAGVATAAITENGAIDRSRGFDRGFDVYVENRDSQSANLRSGHIEETFARGADWLETARNRRFFLFLHTYQVHNPFTPPAAYDRFFSGDPGELARPAALRADWDPLLYDREIRYADDRVAALVGSLRAAGLLEDTLLVVTSDHGEAFLEHGFAAHGASVHHEVVNVPLLVSGPRIPAGRRLKNPVPMVDLMPTLLDLMGVAASGGEMGRSQAALVEGAPEPDVVERAIYSEAWAERAYRAEGFDLIPQPTLALRLRGRKLVRSRTDSEDPTRYRYELYDLVADPLERNDLYPHDPSAADDLLRILRRYERAVKGRHARLASPATDSEPRLDPDLEEKLRALGYLE